MDRYWNPRLAPLGACFVLLLAALLLAVACLPVAPAVTSRSPASSAAADRSPASVAAAPSPGAVEMQFSGTVLPSTQTAVPDATPESLAPPSTATPVPLAATQAPASPTAPPLAATPSAVAPRAVPSATAAPQVVAPSPTAFRLAPSDTPAGQVLSRQVEILTPLLIDSRAGLLYAPARAGAARSATHTAVLSAADGQIVALYDLAGPLGLDPQHGRLYVDRGDDGLAVLEAATGKLLRTVTLPAASGASDGSPAPQADPGTGRVFAMRNNSVYVIDGENGQILSQIDFDLRPQEDCHSHDALLPVAGSRYDMDRRILYLDFVTYLCTPWIGYTIVSFDMGSGKEIARGGASPFQAIAAGGRQVVSSWYRMGAGTMELWRDGKPASQSTEWSGGSGLPVLDSRRGRVYYETIAGDLLRVFDAGTLRLLAVLPQPLPGQIVGFDPGTDQLYFLKLGRLQPLPAASFSLPAPQQPAPAAAPPSPAALLAVSPGYAADKTMFAVWGSEMTREGCYVFGQVGGTLLRSSDGGQSWRRPQAGLPGDCAAYTSALAVSPAYPQDHTVFAGIAGSGLFKSTDGGALWAPVSGPASSMVVRQILLSPAYGRDQTVFVVEETAMERSTDGGGTWTRSGDLSARVAALSPEFDQDGTLVAWGYAAGSQTGLKISRDRGQRWEDLSDPIRAPGSATVVGLSLAPAFDRWQVMFAVDSRGNVHRSSDGGKSWQVVANTNLTDAVGAHVAYGPGETNRPVFMLITRRDNSVQAPSLTGRLYRSGDGGQTWQGVNPGAGIDPTALALSPEFAQDGLLLLGSTGTVVAVKAMELAVQP